MFEWKNNYKWIFSELGAADKVGVNDAGIGIFKRQPYKGLAKEINQNITDAKDDTLPDDVPVRARFELIYVNSDDIPDYKRLDEVIHKCYQYYSEGDDGEKLKIICEASKKYLKKGVQVPVLKISDYNTYGLLGVRKEKGSNWTGLVRERSATNKSNGLSGAFGVGKFAPYNFSALRTVLYSTKTKDGEIAFQGKAILTTFSEYDTDKQNNIVKQNIGLFADANSDNFDAVFSVDDIAPVFRRYEVGTDLFVLGFEKEEDWVEQSAISVIEYFFYSIYRGKLEVEIVEGEKIVTINKSNLGEKIAYYDEFCKENMSDDPSFRFTAPSYWAMLTSPNCKSILGKKFEYKGHSMGEYELYLLVGDECPERKVLEMRQAGMKIREDTNFRIQTNFTAVFIATGANAISEEPDDNISSFLRKCENQAHDDWAADEYKEKKEKARGIINNIHSLILEAVKAEMPDMGDKSIDAFGLREFLRNEDEDDEKKEEKAFGNFKPLDFELKTVKTGKRRKQADISMKKNGGSKKRKTKKSVPDSDTIPSKHKKTDNHRGTGLNKVSEVYISNIKTPYDTATGEYQISFVVDETVENLMIAVKISSDDNNLSRAEILKATRNDKTLIIKNGMVELGVMSEGDKVVLRMKIAERVRKTLEVRGYAKY
jgi:hypothetical protein